MEPEGILNACTTNARMTRANRTATIRASAYSRRTDLPWEKGLACSGVVRASSSVLRTLPLTLLQRKTDNRSAFGGTTGHFRSLIGCRLSVFNLKLDSVSANLQHGHESLLGDFHATDLLHAPLALPLFFQELPLARDVPPVALGRHLLPQWRDALPGNAPPADGGLDHHLEELARDALPHLLRQQATERRGLLPVDDAGQGVHRLAVDQDVQLLQGTFPKLQEIVIQRGVPPAHRLEAIIKVQDDFVQRQLVGDQDPVILQVLDPPVDAPLLLAEGENGSEILHRCQDGGGDVGLLDPGDLLRGGQRAGGSEEGRVGE